jgi:ubiquitin thioesterase OTU1
MSVEKKTLQLRARTKAGLVKITNLYATSTLSELKRAIADLTGIDSTLIKLLKGYPPKQFDHLAPAHSTLNHNQIKDGELLTVDVNATETSPDIQSINIPAKKSESDSQGCGVLLRKVVPANNSCLFTSVNFVMSETGTVDLDCQKEMRQLIASTVKSDPIFYSDAILGKKVGTISNL